MGKREVMAKKRESPGSQRHRERLNVTGGWRKELGGTALKKIGLDRVG